jgi:hypothetical protein
MWLMPPVRLTLPAAKDGQPLPPHELPSARVLPYWQPLLLLLAFALSSFCFPFQKLM